jgi:hypothetical protein
MSAVAATAAAAGPIAAAGAETAAGVQPRSDKGGSNLPTKLCAFCGGDAGAYGGQLGRMQGPFFTSSKGHDAVYVHHECALWSPNVRYTLLLLQQLPGACGQFGCSRKLHRTCYS